METFATTTTKATIQIYQPTPWLKMVILMAFKVEKNNVYHEELKIQIINSYDIRSL